jgi:hypothetical protein
LTLSICFKKAPILLLEFVFALSLAYKSNFVYFSIHAYEKFVICAFLIKEENTKYASKKVYFCKKTSEIPGIFVRCKDAQP